MRIWTLPLLCVRFGSLTENRSIAGITSIGDNWRFSEIAYRYYLIYPLPNLFSIREVKAI